VDLLYNGGIGTYVKAAAESHLEVGDRANDALRINGRELRCQVVCEGGNLGLTQRGRIEAAQLGNAGKGVRLYTDAIDNSAGVDTSDHEVNIKILLGLSMAEGELTEKQRNHQLAELTDDVAALVLRDNYFQTQILSLTRRTGPRLLDAQTRFIRHLEKFGLLNRAIEFLPSDEEIAERKLRGDALTSPELAVLLAYSKMWLSDQLVESDLPDDPWVATALARYFPLALSERFASVLPRHPLRREIIATHVLNSMINRVGITFVHRLMEATGAQPAQVVRAYLLTRQTFGHVDTWRAIEALDNKVPDQAQFEMLTELDRLTLRGTRWFLRSRRLVEPMVQTIARYMPAISALAARLLDDTHTLTRMPIEQLAKPWIDAGVPAELARRVASAEVLVAALDVTELAEQTKQPLERVADVLVAVGERLGLSKMRALIAALPSDNYWQGLAKGSLNDDLANLQRLLTAEALQHATSDDVARTIAAWEQGERAALERAQRLLQELAEAKGADLAMLSVALRELRNLA
jgi:glutamate dehydrogenase